MIKNKKTFLIILITMFIFNTKVFAISGNMSVNTTNTHVGNSFTITVNISSVAAWNIHVNATGPVNDCIINEVNYTDNALNTNKTFSTECVATGEGTITIVLSGDATSETDETIEFSDTKTINVTQSQTPNIIHVTNIRIIQKNHTMYVNDTYTLQYIITPNNSTNQNVTWSSNNKKVATVDSKGKVTAKDKGTAIITVKSVDGNIKAQSTIKVVEKPKPTTANPKSSSIKPSEPKITITMNEHNISVTKGKEYTLTAKVTGSNAGVIWESSNKEIATVENGKVQGIKEGKVTIRAKVKGTTISDVCEVKVIAEEESGIKFPNEETIVYLGINKDIELITSPADLKIDKIEYEIENEEIISVENGEIKGLTIGNSKLKIKVNGKYTAETRVIVKEEPMTLNITGYDINFSENIYSYELEIKKEKELNISSNKDIEIKGNKSLKNKSVITVINNETNKEYKIIVKKNNSLSFLFPILAIVSACICSYTFIKRRKK